MALIFAPTLRTSYTKWKLAFTTSVFHNERVKPNTIAQGSVLAAFSDAGHVAVSLFMVRALTGGIELKEVGFKRWRFGRFVLGEGVRAITCEEQPFPSRAFCLKPLAHRLTVYAASPSKSVGKLEKIVPHSIPFLQFTAQEFQSLLVGTLTAFYIFMTGRKFSFSSLPRLQFKHQP